MGRWEYTGPNAMPSNQRILYGPGFQTGRATDVCFDPFDANTLFVSSAGGGIWKTTDSGVSWRSVGDALLTPFVSVVRAHPTVKNLIFAGLGDRKRGIGTGNGILRSEDGGETWTHIPLREDSHCTDFFFSKYNPNLMTVSFTGGGGVFYSTDRGITWTNSPINGNPNAEVTDMASGYQSYPRPLWAWVKNAGLYTSTNHGATWVKHNQPSSVLNTNVVAIGGSEFNSQEIVYLVDATQKKIFRGTYNGNSWTELTSGFPHGNATYGATANWDNADYPSVEVIRTRENSDRDYIYVGLKDLAASRAEDGWEDVGKVFTSQSMFCYGVQAVAACPINKRKIAVATLGGIYIGDISYVSSTDTASWAFNTSANQYLGINTLRGAAYHPTDPNFQLTGAYIGSPISRTNLGSWSHATTRHAQSVAIHPTNPNLMFLTSPNQGTYFTPDNWQGLWTWSNGIEHSSDTMPDFLRLVLDPTQPGVVYYGSNYLYRYTLNTLIESRLGGQNLSPSGGVVSAIAIAPTDRRVLYVGTTTGDLWKSINLGANWVKLDDVSAPAVPLRAITAISVHPTNADSILFTLSGAATSHVYSIDDTASAIPVLTDRSGNGIGMLPDIQTNWITRDHISPSSKWFVATDVGVFMTSDGGANWANAGLSYGLPICEVSTVDWIPGTGYLQAATYGRGMWRLKLADVSNETDTTLTYQANPVRNTTGLKVVFSAFNQGTAVASDVRIETAQLSLAGSSPQLVSQLPAIIGEVAPGATQGVSLLWSGPKMNDLTGKLKVTGTYRVGINQHSFTYTQVVNFP